jgi:hypothetical protein
MEDIIVRFIEKPKFVKPILIEGLPGVGNVGKLAAEHLIGELRAVKFADIYSKYFPPQVLVNDAGLIKLVDNELYYCKNVTPYGQDLIILVGDFQGVSGEGQYELSDAIIRVARDVGVKKIYTLGGYGVGRVPEKIRVFGAATHPMLVKEMEQYGVVFSKSEPTGGIIGASGLLLGLGKLYGIECICLMGETSGFFSDPKSAEAVLKVLTRALNIKIDFKALEVKALQMDEMAAKLLDFERRQEALMRKKPPEDLGYFG